jgi:hypothetical protein
MDDNTRQQIKALHDEGKEFIKLKSASDTDRPSNGTPAFLVAREWLDKYKDFCFYKDIRFSSSIDPNPDHMTAKYPGKIANEVLLDTKNAYLKGTGKLKEFESSVYDAYLNKEVRERMHYEVVTQELWDFLQSRYGCDHEIKRYYSKAPGFFSSITLETRLKTLPVFFAHSKDLYAGKVKDRFEINFVQMSATKTFSDLRKRLLDVLEANGLPDLKAENLRMWLGSNKNELLTSFEQIAEKMEDTEPMSSSGTTEGKCPIFL